MSSWENRVRPLLKMRSPFGEEHIAEWAGDQTSFEKKLGVFSLPGVDGAVIQDLGVTAASYPIRFFFEGVSHDKLAAAFKIACRGRGPWEIIHPVEGLLELNLVSVSEIIDPVKSANITEFSTSWLQAGIAGGGDEITGVQVANSVIDKARKLQALPMPPAISTDTFSKVTAIKSAVSRTVDLVQGRMADLYKGAKEINARVDGVVRSIQDTITSETLDIVALGGQIRTLIELPARATTDIVVRLDAYSALIEDVFSFMPGGRTPDDRNISAVYETALVSVNTAMASVVASGSLISRPQVISVAQQLSAGFNRISGGLDEIQAGFQNTRRLSDRYFTQTADYEQSADITATALNYLLRSAFDLLIEKRITLIESRTPIEIAITEYGDPEKLDFLIESNGLKGNDILLLRAGSEVLVYV